MDVAMVSDAARLAGELVALGASVTARAPGVVAHHAGAYRARVAAAAPRRTGHYASTITVEPAGPATFSVGSDHPAARRLEFGFVGVDSLGRHYTQAPQPHYGVGQKETADGLEAGIAALVS